MELAHDHGNALKHIHRFETGDNAGNAVLLRQELIRLHANNGAYMTRQNKRINPQRRIRNDGFQRTRHVFMRHEHAEVLKAQRLGTFNRHGD